MPADKEFMRQLRATFMVEAREHAQALSNGVLQLEQAGDSPSGQAGQAQILESIFRAAHSLKGAARAVELVAIESLCQSLEDVFSAMRRGVVDVSGGTLDVLLRALDAVGVLLDALDESRPAKASPDLPALRRQLRQLLAVSSGVTPGTPGMAAATVATSPNVIAVAAATAMEATPAAIPPQPAHQTPSPLSQAPLPLPSSQPPSSTPVLSHPLPADETVRVLISNLELQLIETEELLVSKLAASERVNALRETGQWFTEWRKVWAGAERHALALRKSAAPGAGELLAFCDWSNDAVRTLEARIGDIRRAARQEQDTVGKSVDHLLAGARQLLLLPFATISASFPRMVRELSRSQGTEADLVITGEQTQVDKHILEEIKDPLLHMLRNAVAHAIELPAARRAAGKNPRATVRLSVTRGDAQRVHIVLADDGRGIDTARVRQSAVERGLLSAEQAASLDEAGALALVFRSEVTTGAAVTPLSGRGLGLAIAHEHVQRLGGELRVRSKLGEGTTFELVLPAVRATFRGVLCEAGGHVLVVPVNAIELVGRVKRTEVRSVEGRQTVVLGGKAVALVQLGEVLGLAPAGGHTAVPASMSTNTRPVDLEYVHIMLINSGDESIALAVDAIIEEQEVLQKPLRKPLVRVRNIAAAAVLGSGRVVPILNVADLMKSARNARAGGVIGNAPRPPAAALRRSVLVAEDSITSRMLLKTILEAAGYVVTTAVDGLEAFALLRSEPFDLLVSDVEMPRLDGFGLTARVRADSKLADMPVVLVTALARREDRERGIDAGANAYIVKGSFDQNNLVETVRRLI